MSQLKDSQRGEREFFLTQCFVLFGPSVDWLGTDMGEGSVLSLDHDSNVHLIQKHLHRCTE